MASDSDGSDVTVMQVFADETGIDDVTNDRDMRRLGGIKITVSMLPPTVIWTGVVLFKLGRRTGMIAKIEAAVPRPLMGTAVRHFEEGKE